LPAGALLEEITFGREFRRWVVKKEEKEFLFEYIDETLDSLEKEISFFDEGLLGKGPRIVVKEENRKKNKADKLIQAFNAFNDSRDGIVEVLNLIKAIRETDAKANSLYLELQRELGALEIRKEKVKESSQRLKELIETYRAQIKKVMELLEKLPVESDEDFSKKLQLIDRANNLLRELSSVVLKFLTA
jgi:hypothetical protein